jgi:hypothetical protein
MFLHPEGVERVQPGGFNPGITVRRRRALKGRQIERPNKVEIGGQSGQIEKRLLTCKCLAIIRPAVEKTSPRVHLVR